MSAAAPRPAVLAVAARAGRVALARRANPPDAGLWGFPGGKIESGEPLAAAALRELREETGLTGRAGPVLAALDAIDRDASGEVRFHYVLIAVAILDPQGQPRAADDALEAGWFSPAEIDRLPTSRDVAALARLALARGNG